jgi:hypothetical protein
MIKPKQFISMAGAILFVISVIGLLYGLNAPSKLSNVTYYALPPSNAFPEMPELFLALFYLMVLPPIFLLILGGLLIWGIKNRKSLSLHQIGKRLWSHAYFILSTIAGLYLVVAMSFWLALRESDSATEMNTIRYGESPTSGNIDYFAVTEVTAPKELKFGTSSEIVLKMWITQGVVPTECSSLSPNLEYSAIVSLQAGNLDIDYTGTEQQALQVLALDHPAIWSWVVSPKEKRLGEQSIVIRAFLQDQFGHKPGSGQCASYLSLKTSIRDPLGLPPSMVYGAMAFGGVLGVPFWTWAFTEWSTRQKEKREQKRRLEEKIHKNSSEGTD